MGGRRAIANMYTIQEADEASIAAACEAEQKLESGQISGWISLMFRWFAALVAVLTQCAALLFLVVAYSTTEQHPGRLLLLLLLLLMCPFIYWFAKGLYSETNEYIEATKLIKKAKELQDEMNKITQRLHKRSRHSVIHVNHLRNSRPR